MPLLREDDACAGALRYEVDGRDRRGKPLLVLRHGIGRHDPFVLDDVEIDRFVEIESLPVLAEPAAFPAADAEVVAIFGDGPVVGLDEPAVMRGRVGKGLEDLFRGELKTRSMVKSACSTEALVMIFSSLSVQLVAK